MPNAKPLSTQELRNLGLVDQVSFGVIVCFYIFAPVFVVLGCLGKSLGYQNPRTSPIIHLVRLLLLPPA